MIIKNNENTLNSTIENTDVTVKKVLSSLKHRYSFGYICESLGISNNDILDCLEFALFDMDEESLLSKMHSRTDIYGHIIKEIYSCSEAYAISIFENRLAGYIHSTTRFHSPEYFTDTIERPVYKGNFNLSLKECFILHDLLIWYIDKNPETSLTKEQSDKMIAMIKLKNIS
jgi:hypothetical protein